MSIPIWVLRNRTMHLPVTAATAKMLLRIVILRYGRRCSGQFPLKYRQIIIARRDRWTVMVEMLVYDSVIRCSITHALFPPRINRIGTGCDDYACRRGISFRNNTPSGEYHSGTLHANKGRKYTKNIIVAVHLAHCKVCIVAKSESQT